MRSVVVDPAAVIVSASAAGSMFGPALVNITAPDNSPAAVKHFEGAFTHHVTMTRCIDTLAIVDDSLAYSPAPFCTSTCSFHQQIAPSYAASIVNGATARTGTSQTVKQVVRDDPYMAASEDSPPAAFARYIRTTILPNHLDEELNQPNLGPLILAGVNIVTNSLQHSFGLPAREPCHPRRVRRHWPERQQRLPRCLPSLSEWQRRWRRA